MPVAENKEPFPRAQFTVKDTDPVWFYCQQTGHCQKGMVFAINPGESGKLVEFQENARNAPLTPPSPPSTPSHWTSCEDHRIIVGGATLTFQPPNITAQPGDTITFEFHQKNHSATQSSFAAPCQKLALSSGGKQIGFDSGLYVRDLSPILFHASLTWHKSHLACPSLPMLPRSPPSRSRSMTRPRFGCTAARPATVVRVWSSRRTRTSAVHRASRLSRPSLSSSTVQSHRVLAPLLPPGSIVGVLPVLCISVNSKSFY